MGTPLNHSDNKKTKKPQTTHSLFSPLANERGVTAMVMALVLIVLVAMASFAIDLGFAWVTKNELQNIADGASLAGGRQLGLVYEGLSEADKQDLTRSLTSAEEARIVAAVMTVAGLNRAGGKQGITIDTANDVTMGTWDFASQTFTPTVVRPTAVTVTARRDNNANGAIATVFAKVMGYNEINISATAVAALGPWARSPRAKPPCRSGSPNVGLMQGASVATTSNFIRRATWMGVPDGIPIPRGRPTPVIYAKFWSG